jgi:hypothetical protein
MKTRKRKQYNKALMLTIHRPQISEEEKSPPAPTDFVGYSHKCGHTIHELYYDFTENNELCPNCTTVLKVWAKEQQANRNLDLRLKEYNNSANFEWPPAVSYCAKSLWINVRSKWILESTTTTKKEMDWWLYMTKMPSFQSFVERDDICVRCMKVESMKHLPTDTREINGAALPNSFDSENNRWNLGQIIKNPGDGSFGLVQFGNGDYAAIGSVKISNEVIESLSRSETYSILKSKLCKRSGSAGGFFHPCEDEEVKKDTISLSKCTRNHRLFTTSSGTGTAVTLHYLNKEQLKRVNSIYPDIAMDRSTASSKRKKAYIDGSLRMKLIGEMKSRLEFLMILVVKNMGSAKELFRSFAAAVKRVQQDKTDSEWKSADACLTDFDCVLLEYACGTGEMRNHQALHAHTDSNKSHPVESMMLFGKVTGQDNRQSTTIVNDMTNGRLIQPYERLVWELKCGYDVLHSRFSVTYHLSDHSRGISNWSYVHGP